MAADLNQNVGRRPIDRLEASQKYSVGKLCYPDNVANADDVQHYMMFYINVRESSKFSNNTGQRLGFVNNEGQNRINAEGNVQVNIPGTGIDVSTTTARDTLYAGTITTGAYAIGKKLAGLGGGAISAAALGVGSAKAGQGTGTETIYYVERTQRISDVITLAIQNRPSVAYGVEWQQNELGTLMGVLGGGSSAADTATLSHTLSSDLARRMMEVTASIPGSLNTNNRVQNMMEVGTKRVANPFREVLFKSVGFRKFQYSYKFMPKSEKESQTVKDIIKTFKLHMHPEIVPSGLYYIYPSDFDIVYYYKGTENTWLNKVSTCALTDMQVDYGNSQTFSTFGDGAPTEITLTLTFTELETLSKERIMEGY